MKERVHFIKMGKTSHEAKCPYGVRDLSKDECYSGNGINRCKWFVKYDWEKHYGCIACTHPVIEHEYRQLSLFGEEV